MSAVVGKAACFARFDWHVTASFVACLVSVGEKRWILPFKSQQIRGYGGFHLFLKRDGTAGVVRVDDASP